MKQQTTNTLSYAFLFLIVFTTVTSCGGDSSDSNQSVLPDESGGSETVVPEESGTIDRFAGLETELPDNPNLRAATFELNSDSVYLLPTIYQYTVLSQGELFDDE